MEFPPPWDFFNATEFEQAAPRDPGELGAELMAQCRGNGRICDHYQIVVGGTKLVEKYVVLRAVIPQDNLPDWSVLISVFPQHIKIRRNMTTGAWFDLRDGVAANDILVYNDDKEAIEGAQLLDILDKLDKGINNASFRWAVVVGEDQKLQLQLQALPSAANYLAGKPMLNG